MSIGTPLAVLMAILFLVPGFIWRKTAQACTPYASTRKTELLECLALSCFNYLIAIPFVWWLLAYWPKGLDLRQPDTLASHLSYLFLWVLLVFLLPIVLGVAISLLLRHRKVKNLLGRFGISILHPAPTAWDYAFSGDCLSLCHS